MQFLIFISNPVGISIFFWLGGSLWGKSKRSPSFPPISHTHPPFLSLPLSSFWQSHTHKPIGRNHKISHHTHTIYISPSSLCKRACACVRVCASARVCGPNVWDRQRGLKTGWVDGCGLFLHFTCVLWIQSTLAYIVNAHLRHSGAVDISHMYSAAACMPCSLECLALIHTWYKDPVLVLRWRRSSSSFIRRFCMWVSGILCNVSVFFSA